MIVYSLFETSVSVSSACHLSLGIEILSSKSSLSAFTRYTWAAIGTCKKWISGVRMKKGWLTWTALFTNPSN